MYYTFRPIQWRLYMKDKIGAEELHRLEKKALEIKQWKAFELEELAQELEVKRDEVLKEYENR